MRERIKTALAEMDTMSLLRVKMFGQLQGLIGLDRSCGTTFRLRFEPKAE